jgi:transposase
MQYRIRLSKAMRQTLVEQLERAYRAAQLRLVKRIHALLALVDGQSLAEVSQTLHLGEQTLCDYVQAFLLHGSESLHYRRPPGRPPRLNPSQRKELAQLISAGPEAAGYSSGCWTSVMVQDLILKRFKVEYHPHYICNLLDQLGFSFQKARFVSDHLDEAARSRWLTETWPAILRLARQTQALLLFGDEASFAQWGSLSYTWAPKGQQPTVKTSGRRKGYKVFGLIEFFSGRLFWKGQTDRFNAASYIAFLDEVLAQTHEPLILIQDGAKYHTGQVTKAFLAAHTDRLTIFQLPSYSPDFNPIEHLWRNVKKDATHLKYFATFDALTHKVDKTMHQFTELPSHILALMGCYCESLGVAAA